MKESCVGLQGKGNDLRTETQHREGITAKEEGFGGEVTVQLVIEGQIGKRNCIWEYSVKRSTLILLELQPFY